MRRGILADLCRMSPNVKSPVPIGQTARVGLSYLLNRCIQATNLDAARQQNKSIRECDAMTSAAHAAPAYVAASTLKATPRAEPLTCSIGAEVKNFDLGAASRDPELIAEIRSLLLTHKVLFF